MNNGSYSSYSSDINPNYSRGRGMNEFRSSRSSLTSPSSTTEVLHIYVPRHGHDQSLISHYRMSDHALPLSFRCAVSGKIEIRTRTYAAVRIVTLEQSMKAEVFFIASRFHMATNPTGRIGPWYFSFQYTASCPSHRCPNCTDNQPPPQPWTTPIPPPTT